MMCSLPRALCFYLHVWFNRNALLWFHSAGETKTARCQEITRHRHVFRAGRSKKHTNDFNVFWVAPYWSGKGLCKIVWECLDRHWPMVAFCNKRWREELVEPIAKTNWTNPKTKGVIIAKYIGDRVCYAQIAMFSFLPLVPRPTAAAPPSIGDGHKTVEVIIDDEHLQVDVDVLAEVSGLFLQIQSTDAKDCPLREFPGGLERFRSIVGFLIDNDALTVVEDTVLDLLEATWLLECPSLLDGVMQSSFVTSLSSRRRVEIFGASPAVHCS